MATVTAVLVPLHGTDTPTEVINEYVRLALKDDPGRVFVAFGVVPLSRPFHWGRVANVLAAQVRARFKERLGGIVTPTCHEAVTATSGQTLLAVAQADATVPRDPARGPISGVADFFQFTAAAFFHKGIMGFDVGEKGKDGRGATTDLLQRVLEAVVDGVPDPGVDSEDFCTKFLNKVLKGVPGGVTAKDVEEAGNRKQKEPETSLSESLVAWLVGTTSADEVGAVAARTPRAFPSFPYSIFDIELWYSCVSVYSGIDVALELPGGWTCSAVPTGVCYWQYWPAKPDGDGGTTPRPQAFRNPPPGTLLCASCE